MRDSICSKDFAHQNVLVMKLWMLICVFKNVKKVFMQTNKLRNVKIVWIIAWNVIIKIIAQNAKVV